MNDLLGSVFAGWVLAIALVAGISGLWVVMLLALASYYLVLSATGLWSRAMRRPGPE